MLSSRFSSRIFLYCFVFTLAVKLLGDNPLIVSWTNSILVAQPKVVAGTTYQPFAAASGGTGEITLKVTKSGGSAYDSTVKATGGVVAGFATTVDTGNRLVTFTATATDSTQHTVTAAPLAITIYVADSTPPTTPTGLFETGKTSNQFTLVWNASSDANPLTIYEIQSNGVRIPNGVISAGSTPYPATYSVNYSGLSVGNTYAMQVRSQDWAGNYSAWSDPLNVTIPVPDTTKPTQPGTLGFSNQTTNSTTVSWGASTDAVGVTGYTVTLMQGSVGGSVISSQIVDPINPSVTFSNLNGNTSYGVSVVAKDAAGNTSSASTGVFTTVDSGKPDAPLAMNVSSTGFGVYWSAYAISPATSYYLVQLNGGTPISAGTGSLSPNLWYMFPGLSPNTAYTVRVSAVSTSGASSSWSDPVTVTTDVADVALPVVARPTGTGNLVAAVGGSLSVDNHGSANYSIPLQIAPGRGGLQPSLALNYSSGASNGVAGVGWSLSTGFFQSITRGRSILARDGETRGIEFSGNDKFYLDGKRLICTSAATIAYGMPGSTYRTEVDSFVTITAIGTGSLIDRFELVDKSGNKFTFGKIGSTTDGFQKGGNEPTAMAYCYALKRVEDTLGNYIAFTYANLGGGEYVLGQIDYTGGSTVAPAAKIVCAYEARPDQPVSYLSTRTFAHRARLAVITATSSDVTVAAYGLNYVNDVNGGRSRLTSVVPVLADPGTGVLQSVPATTINWQSSWQPSTETFGVATSVSANVPNSAFNISEYAQFGDKIGDGKETLVDVSGYIGFGMHSSLGDIDGDGRKDIVTVSGFMSSGANITLNVTLAKTGAQLLSTSLNLSSYFADPITPLNPTPGSYLLLASEGEGAASRVTVADYTGDGLDDVMVHSFDGSLYLFESTGSGFKAARKVATNVGGSGDVNQVRYSIKWWGALPGEILSHAWISPMPCDLNGDGRIDYVFMDDTRAVAVASPTGLVSYNSVRALKGVMSLPDGTFSAPFLINQFVGVHPDSNLSFNNMNTGVFPGDFNGDGLTDFMILDDKGIMGYRWLLFVNSGPGADGIPRFIATPGVIPDKFPLPNTPGSVGGRTYYNPLTAGGWLNLIGVGIPGIFNGNQPNLCTTFMALEGASGATNTAIMDVNHDGLPDLVWYVGLDAGDNSITASDQGWYAYLSTGKFTAATDASHPGSGFVGPVKLSFLQGLVPPDPTTVPQSGFGGYRLISSYDYNGDGHPDLIIEPVTNGAASAYFSVRLATSTSGGTPPYVDLVTNITDGLGRKTDIAYLGAKDSSVYTPGAASVAYPIRDFRASTPVVSEVAQDSGVDGSPARFSYQYSGNHLDLSGRGSLGFHSFVTLDRQTNLFKYQFLAQSFPMTGLTHREETYRWLGGTSFNIITSHDNKIVFDKVMNGGTPWGTLWPFISSATESRWEDGVGNFTTTGTSSLSSNPENIFVQSKPAGAHIVITAQSWFDNQDLNAAPVTTLPTALGSAGYNPSDTSSGGINTVVGTNSFGTFSTLPGAITYGNLRKLYTDCDPVSSPGTSTETVTTSYKDPQTVNGVVTLTGLANTIDTSAKGGGYTDSAPQKSYSYFGTTPLVSTETVSGGGSLTTTTTYNRDALGRVISTEIDGIDLQSLGQGSAHYTTSQNTAFDARWDLPTTTLDNYGHTTTTVYHSFLGKPTSVTDVNGAQTTTAYDALARPIAVTDVLKNLTTTSTYAWDGPSTQSVSGPAGFNGASFSTPSNGVAISGVTLTSAYKITTTATVNPTVTTYYDRLGRVIRTIKDGFNGTAAQQVITDSAYNSLGQQIATSLPYVQGTPGTPLWTKTTYDPLGRAASVTAPNSTVTTNEYTGRTTKVTVTPVVGLAQSNATLVDAKGHTVSVWNADNIGGSTPSIAFTLDGFGRMRVTTLLGQTQTIAASYDSLGRQIQLADPDKGTWNYVNSALGQVLTQTDNAGNSTSSTFDQLGRPLSRATTGNGSTETANFYYYDTSTVTTALQHTVAKGTQGWIGAPERAECSATGSYPTTNLHYYDSLGRPALELAQSDGKWFYTYSDYDNYSRIRQVRHYWKPAGAETPSTQPYLWQDFGYVYTYDGTGAASKSYLTNLTDSLGRSWWDTPVYDYMDRVTSVRKGSGLTTTRTYRPEDGVLTAINTGSGSIQNETFNFDGLGNLIARSDTGVSESYDYDNLNRLITRNSGTIAAYKPNGNINSKTEVGGSTVTINSYDAARPHAVSNYTFNGQATAITYNGNGNLLTRSGGGTTWSMNWTGFDKPRWMAKITSTTTAGSEFHYNAARSRVMQLEFDQMSGGVPSRYVRKRTYALGSTLELNYTTATPALSPVWNLDTVRIYVPGPDGIIGAREFHVTSGTNGTEKAVVYHYDHLGSITAITDFGATTVSNDSGGKPGKFSEDAWGQRRNPFTWSGAPQSTGTNKSDDGSFDSLTPRGFTGHEMLDDLGLVHMNGRIYDPLLGRFLSADILVQAPGNLQSYNRYSYVGNNPLSATDPSGFESAPQQKNPEEEQREEQRRKAREERERDAKTSAITGPSPVDNMIETAREAASNAASLKAQSAQPAGTPATNRASAAKPKAELQATINSTTAPSSLVGAGGNSYTRPSAENNFNLSEGTYVFVEGHTYLHAFNGKANGSLTDYDNGVITTLQKLGVKIVSVDTAGKGATQSWSDFFSNTLGKSASFTDIFWTQHGGPDGPINAGLAESFRADIAPALSPFLAKGGNVVLRNCYGVFPDGYIDSVKSSFNGAPVWTAGGLNAMYTNGIVSAFPNGNGGTLSGVYSTWVKH